MDEIDIKIFKILSKDARMPFTKIGKMLGISNDSVKRRFERVKKRNPDLNFSVILDVSKLGFQSTVGFCLKLTHDADHNKIKDLLLNCPRIVVLTEALGDFDFYFDVFTVDYNDLFELYDYLGRIEEVESLNIFFWNANPQDSLSEMSNRFIFSLK